MLPVELGLSTGKSRITKVLKIRHCASQVVIIFRTIRKCVYVYSSPLASARAWYAPRAFKTWWLGTLRTTSSSHAVSFAEHRTAPPELLPAVAPRKEQLRCPQCGERGPATKVQIAASGFANRGQRPEGLQLVYAVELSLFCEDAYHGLPCQYSTVRYVEFRKLLLKRQSPTRSLL